MLDVLPIDNRPNACRLVDPSLNLAIEIDGLSPQHLHWRLYRQGQPWQWLDLAGTPAISVRLENKTRPEAGSLPMLEKNLDDGLVRLFSGGHAEIEVRDDHCERDTILPVCLNLALSQQWAQAGALSLHAAAFLTPWGGVLATGQRGAGKSTLAAAALAAGYPLITDDWLLLKLNQQSVTASRIRDFLMLRHSWASQTLRNKIGPQHFRPTAAGNKQLLRFPNQDARFPDSGVINSFWHLKRPKAGRQQQSGRQALSRASAMARLIESSMPLLFSPQLPFERAQLLDVVNQLTRQLASFQIVGGLDLPEHPAAAIKALSSE